ncbi:MAG TPA: UbiA family prenyltransferase [Bryobacteraceae bacterium]|nr:UbiA family prenyltransferase [Bryobacteraceae bacterium]
MNEDNPNQAFEKGLGRKPNAGGDTGTRLALDRNHLASEQTLEDFGPVNRKAQSFPSPPLAVDLDGTLVKTNLLLESLLALLRERPQYLFLLPVWLLKGKAHLKQQVASRVSLDVTVLPYRDGFLDYLRAQRAEGRFIVLATGGDGKFARQVADHLKLFDLVCASDGKTNLAGESKRDRLVREFGEKGFDYAGDARRDLVVWSSARKAIVVNLGPFLSSRAAKVAAVDRIFKDRRKGFVDHLKALRPHHWVKNLLVFVPLLAAHRFEDTKLIGKTLLAFVAFGCLASAGYLLNDLFDVSSDRHHPRKRLRPFAAGDLSISYALGMIPVLVCLGCVISALVSPLLLAVACIYFGMSITYSVYARQIVLLDVIVLAGLYALRIVGGSAAVAVWPSPWLLAFSTFLFFSLALAKRYSELAINHVKARSYELSDQELLAAMGVASGYVAVLVLALYINTATAHILYRRYGLLWFLCPLLLYWISHIWLSAHRGMMLEDPIVFSASDRTSRILMILMAAAIAFAL